MASVDTGGGSVATAFFVAPAFAFALAFFLEGIVWMVGIEMRYGF